MVRNKMKIRVYVLIVLFVFVINDLKISAFSVSDPSDELYTYIAEWEHRGYIDRLPSLRPYPVQLIMRLLEDVVCNGSEKDAGIARKYLGRLRRKFFPEYGVSHTFRGGWHGETYNRISGEIAASGMLTPYLSLSGTGRLFIIDDSSGDLLPYHSRPSVDILPDWADIRIAGRNLKVRQGVEGVTSYGTDKLYFQSGIIRSSFGPFFSDGAVVSPYAPQSGRFSLTWRHNDFSYTSALLELVASDNSGQGRYPGKYLVLHSLNIYPFDWLEVSGFETVMYGGRFEPLYLVPFSEFFYTQGLIGFPDNSLLGITAKVKLPEAVRFDFLLYADDLHFNDMMAFDFDTKYKLSIQTGLSWAPDDACIGLFSIDYLLVTPYMYTHRDSSPNWLNYTHLGVNLGPSLDPNSDRLTFSALLHAFPFLDMRVEGTYIRHGNGSVDGDVNVGDGDGSIFDDGYDDNGVCTFQDTTRFMSQNVIEKTYRIGVSAVYEGSFSGLDFHVTGGYTFEYIMNKGLDPDKIELNSIYELSAGVRY